MDEKTVKTGVLKIRGNALIFKNTVYQISSLSEVRAMDLSTKKEVPGYYYLFLLLGGLIFAGDPNGMFIGIAGIAVFVFLLIKHHLNKVNERYGLFLSLNSGGSSILVSKDLNFLIEVVILITNAMNKKAEGSVNVNFDNRTINEITDSPGAVAVSHSKVSGDVASSVT